MEPPQGPREEIDLSKVQFPAEFIANDGDTVTFEIQEPDEGGNYRGNVTGDGYFAGDSWLYNDNGNWDGGNEFHGATLHRQVRPPAVMPSPRERFFAEI